MDSILFSPLTVDAIRHANQDMIIPAWQHMVGMLKLEQALKTEIADSTPQHLIASLVQHMLCWKGAVPETDFAKK